MIDLDVRRWERAQSIFMDAVELPVEQQQNFIEAMCGNDREMIGDVRGLLEEDGRQQPMLDGDPGSRLGEVADAALHSDHIKSLVEKQIGPYRLLHVLGEGGMGIVYMAERIDIGGLVAIKLLRDAWLSPMRRERFILEQQTLVKLNHPSIARLYDASTMEDGTPWFVMEYADGKPLTEYLRERDAGIREDLILFRNVCEAVRYAHSLTIIHRDLKPSNIYVTKEGKVKLLDFGIAKDLTSEADRNERTVAGLRLLSREYAAPEQFSGREIGVFTDVYSLGVLLYEVLADHLPESAETRGDKPVKKPSSAARRNGNASRNQLSKEQWTDLDVLCTTALQIEPERRYLSVDAMVRDLTAYLEGRVLEARPASLVYTAGKFVRRHRVALAGIAAGLFVLAGSGIYFTLGLAHARDAAVAEAARTARIQKFLFDMIGNDDAVAGPANDLKVSTLLDREAQRAGSLAADADTQSDLYVTLGTMYDRLGRYADAEKMFSLAMGRAEQTTDQRNAKLAAVLLQRGALHGDEGDFKSARQDMQQAIDLISTSRSGPQDASLNEARIGMSRIDIQSSNPQKAIEVLTPIALQDPKHKDVNPEEVRDAVSALAIAELSAHHYDRAEAYGEKAIALDRELLGESHAQTGTDIINLAAVKSTQGDFPAAERLYREGRGIILAWYGPDHPDVATASSFLAKILSVEGKYKEAEPLLLDALRIQEKAYGPKHERVSFTLDTLGVIAVRQHDFTTAEADLKRALAIDQSLFGDDNYKTAVIRSNLAVVYQKENKKLLAEATLRQSVDVLALLPPGNNLIATARARWGSSLLALKRYPEAKIQLSVAEQLLKSQASAPSGELAVVQRDLSTLAAETHHDGIQ